jgi:hypothetical protein
VTGAEKDDFVSEAEEEEEEEEEEDSECSNYRVTPEEPQAATARLQIPPEAKLIGGKQIRFLGLMSGGHECKFLEEAGSSFAIPHEEEYFRNISSTDLITACGDLALKNFLTPKIGTGRRLICGPNLVTNPVQQGKISSEDSAEMPAVGSLFLLTVNNCIKVRL